MTSATDEEGPAGRFRPGPLPVRLDLLLRLLAGLGRCRTTAGSFGFGFLLGDVALRLGLVLLRLALASEIVTARHGARNFLRLALGAGFRCVPVPSRAARHRHRLNGTRSPSPL